MPFQKGNRLGGRKKGVPNKVTVQAREAFQLAFDGIGGAPALQQWGLANLTEFFKLYARLIPVEHTGKDGDAAIQTVVKHIIQTSADTRA